MKLVFLFSFFLSLLNASSFRVENSLITYFGVHYLHKWEGSTSDVKGVVSYDKNIDQYECSISVPLNTFSSGNDNRDSNMLVYCKAFDFPNINFQSTSIKVNESTLEIEGKIEFAGEEKEIKTNAKLNSLDNNLFAIEGELDILLSEFKVERPSLLFVEIEDLVKIKYSIQGVKNE
jgi:polyisoprenoid-binding protein YceI|tara:strand:- start:269 stop:796 length:528 start_codon:yes stop_codon:yes gene_type:complete